MSDTKNVKLGVCRIYFDGVDLGYTKGGVEVEVSTETHKVMVDQFGNSEVNEYVMGRTVKARIPLAETTLANMVRIMPGATLVGGGTKASGNFAFSGQPSDGDTITLNGVVFTFKTAATLSTHIEIQGNLNATLAHAVVVLNASPNSEVRKCSYTSDADQIFVEYNEEGTAGNSFTLADAGANITASGANLTGGAGSAVARVDVQHGIGTSLLDIAKELILHPVANADDDQSDDFIIPKAATAGALQFAYKLDEERIFNVEFTGYPDANTKILFKVGDPAAV